MVKRYETGAKNSPEKLKKEQVAKIKKVIKKADVMLQKLIKSKRKKDNLDLEIRKMINETESELKGRDGEDVEGDLEAGGDEVFEGLIAFKKDLLRMLSQEEADLNNLSYLEDCVHLLQVREKISTFFRFFNENFSYSCF